MTPIQWDLLGVWTLIVVALWYFWSAVLCVVFTWC